MATQTAAKTAVKTANKTATKPAADSAEAKAVNKSIKKSLKMLSTALDIKIPKGDSLVIRRKKMVKKIKKRLERAKGQTPVEKAAE